MFDSPSCPPRHLAGRTSSPLRPALFLVLPAALLASACGPTPGETPPVGSNRSATRAAPGTVQPVTPPSDLEQLDLAVREQFDELYAAVADPTGEGKDSASAEAWGAVGQWFDVYGYEESAAAAYANAQLLAPDEPRWHYHEGRLVEALGRIDEAEDAFRRAAERAPAVAAPRVRLGDLALRRQELDRADELYRRVLADDPDQAGALLGVARVALARDDAEAALDPLEELSRRQPEAVQVNYSLSLAWRRLGDDEAADRYLALVPQDNLEQLALDEDIPWDEELQRRDVGSRTLTRRGVRAHRRGEPQRAANLLGSAVSADPTGPEKRINYALALRELGRVADAVGEFQAALRLAEEGTELKAKAHLELGRLLRDVGRSRAAASHLEAALAINDTSTQAHVLLGGLRHRQGRLSEAVAHYAAVRALDRAVEGAPFWHAALLLALDRREDAWAATEEDLAAGAALQSLRLLRARMLATQEPPAAEAARDLLEASSSDGADVLFAETAAMVAAAEGRFDEAVAWQQTALNVLGGLRSRSPAHTARRRLALYREQQACRTPWEAGERWITKEVETP